MTRRVAVSTVWRGPAAGAAITLVNIIHAASAFPMAAPPGELSRSRHPPRVILIAPHAPAY